MYEKKNKLYILHFNGVVGFRDRVQIGEVNHGHGRRLFLEDAAEFDIKTVGCRRTTADGGRGCGRVWFSRGDGHDLGLRVPVVADVVGHGLSAADSGHCSRHAAGRATADHGRATAAVVHRVDAAAVVAAPHVSGGVRGTAGRQVADAAAAQDVVSRLKRRRGRGLVERPEFGGDAVVDDVEAHGGQRHAGQYVHGTEPHGGRAGQRHFERPRRVAEPDGAEQHEAEEHAVQVRASAAAAVQPVQHCGAAADVSGHEREADQQQRHEARAVRRGRQLGHGGRRRWRRRCSGSRRSGRRPVTDPLEHVVRVARPHVVRLESVSRERLHVHVAVLAPLAFQFHTPLFLFHELLVVTAVPALGAQATAQRPEIVVKKRVL